MPQANDKRVVVSFDDEPLVLVNAKDEIIGFQDKASCHDGQGTLHRAFSLFVFNGDGELLIQRRAASKRLWPLYWSNSCCSHPRQGEEMQDAVTRRLHEELSLSADLEFLYKFEYQARFGAVGSEHELCWVYVGQTSQPKPSVNTEEISEWRWISCAELDRTMTSQPYRFTPWFELEWQRLCRDFEHKLFAEVGQQN